MTGGGEDGVVIVTSHTARNPQAALAPATAVHGMHISHISGPVVLIDTCPPYTCLDELHPSSISGQ
jgi:hypothetical protein